MGHQQPSLRRQPWGWDWTLAGRKRRVRQAALKLLLVVGLGAVALLAGCSRQEEVPLQSQPPAKPEKPPAYFTTRPADPRAAPTVVQVPVPQVPGRMAIWGSTGRDDRGHLWFGLSMIEAVGASAHLLEYDPEQDELRDRGDVLSALKETGQYRDGESQSKIHSQIIQADDGHLYFASMDHAGADYRLGTEPPTWGGHLWRLRLPENKWEHLLATREGLIAVSGAGTKMYALGFFGHKLYQYDCETGVVQSVTVGSLEGHISRNFITDYRHHAYVPRLWREAGTDKVLVSLVEFDENLKKIHESPLAHYCDWNPTYSHGITAVQPMADHTVIFSTAMGYLYRVSPPQRGYAALKEIGWLHPEKERYVASLFTYTGKNYVIGLATRTRDTNADKRYEWVTYHTGFPHDQTPGGMPLDFTLTGDNAPDLSGCLLYGSSARDNAGNFYVVGTWYAENIPLILKVLCPK